MRKLNPSSAPVRPSLRRVADDEVAAGDSTAVVCSAGDRTRLSLQGSGDTQKIDSPSAPVWPAPQHVEEDVGFKVKMDLSEAAGVHACWEAPFAMSVGVAKPLGPGIHDATRGRLSRVRKVKFDAAHRLLRITTDGSHVSDCNNGPFTRQTTLLIRRGRLLSLARCLSRTKTTTILSRCLADLSLWVSESNPKTAAFILKVVVSSQVLLGLCSTLVI